MRSVTTDAFGGVADNSVNYWLSTGITRLDLAISNGRGIPGGKLVVIQGDFGCLSGDTGVIYSTAADGEGIPSTLESLYRRFESDPDAAYYAPSVADFDGSVFMNRIQRVVLTGEKPCFEITTEGGECVVATADHRFMTPAGWSDVDGQRNVTPGEFRKLDEIAVGDVVCLHTTGAAATWDKVAAVVPVGVRRTYDMTMTAPHNNYVANRFVVHNSNKTTIALCIVRQAQLQGGAGVWIDPEHALSVGLAEDIVGIDTSPDHWSYPQAGTAEQILSGIEHTCVEAAKSEFPLVIVLDSVASMCPANLSAGAHDLATDKWVTGTMAALISRFFSRAGGVLSTIAGRNIYLVFTNQIRDRISMDRFDHGPKQTNPGGRAASFYASVILETSQTKLEDGGIARTGDENTVLGAMVNMRVTKNRVGPPFREARVPFYFHPLAPFRGFDDCMGMLGYLISRKVEGFNGGSWYEVNGVKVQGKLAVRDKMVDDPVFREQCRQLVLDKWKEEHG